VTLRLRLVIALVALVTAGLALFGVATYSFYARSQYDDLDAQLRRNEPLLDRQLDQQAGFAEADGGTQGNGSPGRFPEGGGPGGPPPVSVAPGTFGELRSGTGAVITTLQESNNAAQPRLPAKLPAPPASGRLFTVGSTSGSGGFRVLDLPTPEGGTILVAIPDTEVTNSLHRLVLVEAVGAAVLLLVLSAGSWEVLRRQLRPLERMAGTARSITAGDLSQRVSPAGGPTEMGQLGLALNSMLEDIEVAFAEREATEARLRRFLADASHELRTPLTSIQGFAELFRVSGDDARVDLPTILRRIEEESARMRVLVEDLLLLARLDQTREPERASVDLAVLAADACSDAVATDPTRAVTLDAPEPVVVAGDEAHLRQAIANLVTNALNHTPAGTPVEVSARLVDGAALVSVRDHGPGLDPAALAHAFDRFWRADTARTRARGGSGLGLSIVDSVVSAHGGTIDFDTSPESGTVVTVRLPT
jgi:two-component system OmpR family sensor kinase